MEPLSNIGSLGRKGLARGSHTTVELLGGLEVQVPHDGRWHVHQHPLPTDLERTDVAADQPADAIQPSPLGAVGEWRLELADEDVFEIRQHPARLQEPAI